MNTEVKRQWLRALRIDEYTQGFGALCYVESNSFCCLGVLCALAEKAGVVTSVEDYRSEKGLVRCYDTEFCLLPSSVMEWAGLSENDPRVTHQKTRLSSLNDDGATFGEIANMIEKSL